MTEQAHVEPVAADAEAESRFSFGVNWSQYLSVLTPVRISRAEASLQQMLESSSLRGRRLLDIGCGSGLFSLAARRLGAEVRSFDFDPLSVGCTAELKRRYFPGDPAWTVEQGSVLDAEYMRALGRYDIVYSWGVLHHTGAMWRAIDYACRSVAPGGRLFIAIYNDQGLQSAAWRHVKRAYNRLPELLRLPYLLVFAGGIEAAALVSAIVRLQPRRFADRWFRYETVRGMSRWHDIVDWVGGYPFEVATPKAVIDFCEARGFTLQRLKTCGRGLGCNEFVFSRPVGDDVDASRAARVI